MFTVELTVTKEYSKNFDREELVDFILDNSVSSANELARMSDDDFEQHVEELLDVDSAFSQALQDEMEQDGADDSDTEFRVR